MPSLTCQKLDARDAIRANVLARYDLEDEAKRRDMMNALLTNAMIDQPLAVLMRWVGSTGVALHEARKKGARP